jgi:ribonuclease R
MQDRVGDEFNGTITSVASFGLFIELNDYYVEGLVHITELSNDYYHFDPVRHLLQGERSGLTYQLGDSVTVRLVRVDLEEKKIDLQMVGSRKSRPSKGKLRQSLKAGKVGTRPKTKTKTKNNQGKQRTTRSKKSADKRSESGKSTRTTSEKPAKTAKKRKTKKQIASATARKKGATRGAAKRQVGDSQSGKTVGRKAANKKTRTRKSR